MSLRDTTPDENGEQRHGCPLLSTFDIIGVPVKRSAVHWCFRARIVVRPLGIAWDHTLLPSSTQSRLIA